MVAREIRGPKHDFVLFWPRRYRSFSPFFSFFAYQQNRLKLERGFSVSEEGQIIVCQGCGSKWLVIASNRTRIVARLVECALCENKDV
jgi:hypothetical protein